MSDDKQTWQWGLHRTCAVPMDRETGDIVAVETKLGKSWGVCDVCYCGPCHDDCPVQVAPDTLERKAKRAGKDVVTWLKEHVEYAERVAADPGHARHAELMAVLSQAGPLEPPEREIPVGRAMALAGAVYAKKMTPEQAKEALHGVR